MKKKNQIKTINTTNLLKTGSLVIRLDNLRGKKAGSLELLRMTAISLAQLGGLTRKDAINECKSNGDKFFEIEFTGKMYELMKKEQQFKDAYTRTDFVLAIKKAFMFLSTEQKEKAHEIENNKSWEKVEDMLMFAGIVISINYDITKFKKISTK